MVCDVGDADVAAGDADEAVGCLMWAMTSHCRYDHAGGSGHTA